MRIEDQPGAITEGDYRPAYVVADIRRRALLVSAGLWIAAVVIYLLVAFAADGPPPGCEGGLGCVGTRGVLLGLGMCLLLPLTLCVMAASAIFIVSLSRTARSGLALGVQVTSAGLGVVLTLVAALLVMH